MFCLRLPARSPKSCTSPVDSMCRAQVSCAAQLPDEEPTARRGRSIHNIQHPILDARHQKFRHGGSGDIKHRTGVNLSKRCLRLVSTALMGIGEEWETEKIHLHRGKSGLATQEECIYRNNVTAPKNSSLKNNQAYTVI